MFLCFRVRVRVRVRVSRNTFKYVFGQTLTRASILDSFTLLKFWSNFLAQSNWVGHAYTLKRWVVLIKMLKFEPNNTLGDLYDLLKSLTQKF